MTAETTDDGRETAGPAGPSVVTFRLLSAIAGLLPLAAAFALAALLLALALGRPAADAVDVGAPGDAYWLASFYRADTSDPTTAGFRWSGPGSRLLIPAAGDGPLALELRLRGPAFAPPEALRLQLARDGRAVAELATTPGWRVYRLLLPPDATPEPAPLRLEPLELVAPPAYGAGDPRPLGVALDRFALEAAPGTAPQGPALARALPLAWALALLAAYGAMATQLHASNLNTQYEPSPRPLPRRPLPLARERGLGGEGAQARSTATPSGKRLAPSTQRAAIAQQPWRAAGAVALAGALLALWAWRDPLGFAWAVPTPPLWLLGLASLALLLPAAVGLASAQRRRGRGDAIRPGATPAHQEAAGHNLQSALVALLAAHLLLLAPAPWSGLGALAILLAPGALAAAALFPEGRRPLSRLFLAICGALAVAPMLVLALHAIPGPLPAWALVLAADGLTLTMLWLLRERAGAMWQGPGVREEFVLLTAVLLVAGGLRLWRLGGAEFQGDEARAMLLAAGVAQGADGILLTHTKGPIEALLPAGPLAIAGVGAEWVARMPFALASLAALLGALALLREWMGGGRAALVALAMLAVDGFSVGFGRIVQYQSIVMLATVGALWCCWRFYAGAPWPARHLTSAAVLLAVGLLAHYDAVLVAPALAWLVVAGGLRRGWRGSAWARGLAIPVAVGLALLACFYVPYALGPSFAGTAAYLAGRAGEGDAGGAPFNNLGLYLDILAFYNAPPLVPPLVAATLGAVGALLVRHVRPRPVGLALAATLGLAALAQWLAPALFRLPGGASWAGLAFGAPLAGLCLARSVPAPARAAALWFGVAFCAEAFLIAEPRTHFYTAHVPAALLVGLGLTTIADRRLAPQQGRRQLPGVQVLALVATLVLLIGGGLYAQLVYLRQLPEYQRSFPAARPDLLRASYGDTLPEAGYFGFPHRDGWKAAAELYRAGLLQGSYDTNQNRWLAGWYMQSLASQCKGRPDLYLIAEAEPTVYFPPGYHLVAKVLVGPARALAVYGREPLPGGPSTYTLDALANAFDARPVPAFPAAALLTQEPARCP